MQSVYDILYQAITNISGGLMNHPEYEFFAQTICVIFCLSFVVGVLFVPARAVLKAIRKYFIDGGDNL